tara:strand:+ start:385 stop:630 length:246 start_codon:yes stop_codon:yes gene_type:complete
MDRIKNILVIAIAGLAFMLSTNTVRADSMTPKEFFDRLANIPVKVENHISMEITKTKEYQVKNWQKIKADLLNLKAKFIKQ